MSIATQKVQVKDAGIITRKRRAVVLAILCVLAVAGAVIYWIGKPTPYSHILPPGYEVARIAGNERYLTVNGFFNIDGFRNSRGTNILMGPSVTNVRHIGDFIYGHNSHLLDNSHYPNTGSNDLGVPGYFVIDISGKKIYYDVSLDVINRLDSGQPVVFSEGEVDARYEENSN